MESIRDKLGAIRGPFGATWGVGVLPLRRLLAHVL